LVVTGAGGRVTDFLSARMSEIRPLADAAAVGDVEALQYFGELFGPGEACVLGDKPTGDGRSVRIIGDPADCRLALLMPVCGDCDKRPPEVARKRQVAIAGAVARPEVVATKA